MRTATTLLLLGLSLLVAGQDTAPDFFWEGGLSLNYKLGKSWSANTSLGKRTSWASPEGGTQGELLFLEVDQFVTRKLNPYLKVSLGYKNRQLDIGEQTSRSEQRITQQFAWTHQDQRVRLVSRIRSEQRFRSGTFAQRTRYRFSLDMPLAGERLDAKEFYLALSNELLYEAEKAELNTLDDRISGSLGYLFTKQVKGEMTVTYRVENLTRTVSTRTFFHTRVIISL